MSGVRQNYSKCNHLDRSVLVFFVISSNLIPGCVQDYLYIPAKKFVCILAPLILLQSSSSELGERLSARGQ